MSAFMPIYASEDPNKDLNFSDGLKSLHSPQNIGRPLFVPGITPLCMGFLPQSRVTFLKKHQAHSRLEGASKTL